MSRTLGRGMLARAAFAIAASAVLGCSYPTAHQRAAVAQRFADDSAAILGLQNQIAELRTRYHADSTRWASELAVARAVVPAPVPQISSDSLKLRDAEIASLRDELAKANAELDRIKRRLASPRT